MDTALFEGTLVESERILYTPSTFARTNLIHLQECGRLKALSPHTSHRENLASYLCFIVLEGSGTLEYDQKHYTLSAGDCVFLDCKKSYLHRCSNQLWTLEWAHFYGPNMPGIYEKYTERGGLACFRPQSLAPYQKILDSLCETASSSDYVRDMKIFEQLTARDFTEKAFAANGIELRWEGEGLNEKGYDKATGKMLVCVNPAWFRPTDVDNLWGDPTKAKTVLGWNPQKTSYAELVRIMAEHDRMLAKREKAVKEAGTQA